MKKAVPRLIMFAMTLMLMLPLLCVSASAKVIDGMENVPGDGKYMSSEYVENYAFDSEKLGILDSFEKVGLGLTNILFSLCRYIVFLGLSLFRFAMTLNVPTLMGTQIDTVQTALKDIIFEPMYTVAFIGIAAALVKKLLRRNLTGILADLGKVILILVFVALLAKNTSQVLGGVTSVARNLGLSVVMEMNGRDADANPTGFVDETVGILWGDLIHKPWKEMEFNKSYTDEDIQSILSQKPGSKERQEAVNKYIQAHPGAMAKGGAWGMIPIVLLYTIATIVKLAVYVACSLAVTVFQLLAIFHAFTGVVILTLAMFDSLGGVNLIGDWLKRMLETQLMTLITTMLLGFVIWFGSVLDSVGGGLGWLGGLIFQCIVITLLFLGRKQILQGITHITKNPRAAARQMAGASAMTIAAEMPTALASAYLGNGSSGTSARLTRLDRQEQKSRINANYAQVGFYQAESGRADAERELATTRQETEAYRLEEAEARKAKRQAREETQTRKQQERAQREQTAQIQRKQEEQAQREREEQATRELAEWARRMQEERAKREQASDAEDVRRPTTTQPEPIQPEEDAQDPDVERPTTVPTTENAPESSQEPQTTPEAQQPSTSTAKPSGGTQGPQKPKSDASTEAATAAATAAREKQARTVPPTPQEPMEPEQEAALPEDKNRRPEEAPREPTPERPRTDPPEAQPTPAAEPPAPPQSAVQRPVTTPQTSLTPKVPGREYAPSEPQEAEEVTRPVSIEETGRLTQNGSANQRPTSVLPLREISPQQPKPKEPASRTKPPEATRAALEPESDMVQDNVTRPMMANRMTQPGVPEPSPVPETTTAQPKTPEPVTVPPWEPPKVQQATRPSKDSQNAQEANQKQVAATHTVVAGNLPAEPSSDSEQPTARPELTADQENKTEPKEVSKPNENH